MKWPCKHSFCFNVLSEYLKHPSLSGLSVDISLHYFKVTEENTSDQNKRFIFQISSHKLCTKQGPHPPKLLNACVNWFETNIKNKIFNCIGIPIKILQNKIFLCFTPVTRRTRRRRTTTTTTPTTTTATILTTTLTPITSTTYHY